MTSATENTTKETTAGSYFVSNYPPFTCWSPDEKPQFMSALDRPPADTPLGLYLHIPFCRKRCHFCYFKVYTGANAQTIRTYIDAVERELEMYKDRAFLGGRKPLFIYFGGGTPSFLSSEQLQELTTVLKRQLPWDDAQEIAFECEPGTLSKDRLEFIREMGVTRLSLGVENFDDSILEVNGRAHRSDAVFAVYDFARKIGFPQINIDLISGMVNETEANWQDCVRKTIELDPDSVTIYQMEIPYNTTLYKEMKSGGKVVAPVADWDTKRAWVRYAFEELEKAGYEVSSGYTLVKKGRGIEFLYRDRLWEGADLLSLGVASFGHINGVHYQNYHDIGSYLDQVRSGELPVYRSLQTTEEERLIREFILQLKLGHVSTEYFRNKFNVDVNERFAEPIAQIETWGFWENRNGELRLSREGLLQVDRLLHEFFLPQHRA